MTTLGRAGIGAHHQALRVRAERSDRHVERRALQRVRDIGQRQAEAVEPEGIDRHAHLPLARAELVDARHAFCGEQFGNDVVVDQPGQLGLVVGIAENGKRHDRLGVLVGLDHGHLLDAFGQVALRPADRFANIGRRSVEVDARIELHPDARIVLLARRADLAHARYARDRIFEDAGHLGIHRLGRGAGQAGGDRDDRPVDIGQLAHFHAHQRGDARDHDQQVEHPDQQRPLDRKHRQVGLSLHAAYRPAHPRALRPVRPRGSAGRGGSPARRAPSARPRQSRDHCA
jgi:hypothetical protein